MTATTVEYNGVSHLTRTLPAHCRCVRRALQMIGRALFRVRVQGLDRVPTGNYIVVANHLSWLDPFLLLLYLPPTPRIYIAGAKQAVRRTWQARMMRWLDLLIPFERGAAWVGKDPFRQALGALRAGASLAIFVEGDVGEREGALLPIRRGVGHFLSRVQVPVLPVALSGTRELWWRKPIRMIVGEPFAVCANGANRHEAIGGAVAQVESALQRLLPRYEEPLPRHKRFRHVLTNLGGPMAGMAAEHR